MTPSEPLFLLDSSLRKEADQLLNERGLRSLLSRYGRLYITGSYVTQLMVWRDIDICLDSPDMTVQRFFAMGQEIACLVSPWKMFFTNHLTIPHDTGPRGLYWGIRMGDLKQGAFKIDLWWLDAQAIRQQVQRDHRLTQRLTQETRRIILLIKSQLWDHPDYRDTVTSQDIYNGVLDGGVSSLEELRSWMASK